MDVREDSLFGGLFVLLAEAIAALQVTEEHHHDGLCVERLRCQQVGEVMPENEMLHTCV